MSKYLGYFVLAFIALDILQTFVPISTVTMRRITIEVQTPVGAKIASSVVGLRSSSNPFWGRLLGMPKSSFFRFGEAPIIDLGAGRYLFVPLADNGIKRTEPHSLATTAFGTFREGQYNTDGTPRDIYGWPMLATFSAASGRGSFIEVDRNNLSSQFGPGFALLRLTVIKTDDPVTWGMIDQFRDILRSDERRFVLQQGKPK